MENTNTGYKPIVYTAQTWNDQETLDEEDCE